MLIGIGRYYRISTRSVEDPVEAFARDCARKSALLSDPGAMVGGMSRPRTFDEKRVATAIRLPESVHHRLRQAAIDRDVSANLLVTRAVCDYLDRLCKADDALTVGRSAKSRASR